MKLDRQERMITELKFNKIADETRESVANAKQELRNVIKTGCTKSRSTARCLQLVGNLRGDEDDELDEYAKLQARGVPKFLIEMQARAFERNQRHQEARDRREALEREREEQRLAAERAKQQQDEEAKQKRMLELMEKRRHERLLKQQQEQERLQRIENNRKAVQFYRRLLLTRWGLDRFRQLIVLKRRNKLKAKQFHRDMLQRNVFKLWQKHVQNVWESRKQMADECYRRHLLKVAMNLWIKVGFILVR